MWLWWWCRCEPTAHLDVAHARVAREHGEEDEDAGHQAREDVGREVQVRGRVVDGVLRALQAVCHNGGCQGKNVAVVGVVKCQGGRGKYVLQRIQRLAVGTSGL